jgi:hypothetical protein
MLTEIPQQAIVQLGGMIQIQSPELPDGAKVEVIVILDAPSKPRPLATFIGAAQGSFSTPDEADEFIGQERDTWES